MADASLINFDANVRDCIGNSLTLDYQRNTPLAGRLLCAITLYQQGSREIC